MRLGAAIELRCAIRVMRGRCMYGANTRRAYK
jgi:hypothetical protein